MTRYVLALLVCATACKKKELPPKEDQAPKPPPAAIDAAVAKAPVDEAPCVVQVAIAKDGVRWRRDGASNDAAWKPGTPPDLAALAAPDGCSATLTAAGETRYEEVVAVMDALVTIGIVNIGLDEDPGTPPTGGTLSQPGPNKDALQKAPVIVLTTKQVMLNGNVISELDGSAFGPTLSAALPPKPSDPTIILQADRSLTYAVIAEAIRAAKAASYDNVLFAVKNK